MGILLSASHAEDGRVAIGAALGATVIAGGHLRLRFFLRWRIDCLAERQEEFHHELEPLLRGFAQLVIKRFGDLRIARIGQGGGQTHLPHRISGRRA